MDAIAALCGPCQDACRISVLKEQVDVALAHVERDFPLSLQVKDPCSMSIKSVLVATLLEILIQMCIELAVDQNINAIKNRSVARMSHNLKVRWLKLIKN